MAGHHGGMAKSGLALAVDIGGTKLAVGLVGPEGDVLASRRCPTPAHGTADQMWDALFTLGRTLYEEAGSPELVGIGVGCAGPMIWPAGIVSPLNIPAWRRFPLRRRIMDLVPDVPVRVHNDAVAMAIAEHWKGAAAGWKNAMGMVISTGVGGGIVMADHLINGGLGNAGHVGHMVVYPDGPPCVCGGRGCLERMASGPNITNWAVEQGWTPRDPAAEASAKTLAQDATAGDPIAIAAYRRSGAATGIALASVGGLLDIGTTVIGGGLIQAGSLLMDPLMEAFTTYAKLPHAARMKIVPAALGQDAGIIGAAALVQMGHRYWGHEND